MGMERPAPTTERLHEMVTQASLRGKVTEAEALAIRANLMIAEQIAALAETIRLASSLASMHTDKGIAETAKDVPPEGSKSRFPSLGRKKKG